MTNMQKQTFTYFPPSFAATNSDGVIIQNHNDHTISSSAEFHELFQLKGTLEKKIHFAFL